MPVAIIAITSLHTTFIWFINQTNKCTTYIYYQYFIHIYILTIYKASYIYIYIYNAFVGPAKKLYKMHDTYVNNIYLVGNVD